MKQASTQLSLSSLLFAALLHLLGFSPSALPDAKTVSKGVEVAAQDLKAKAFNILDAKCNSCHRKRNPFRVFTQKNMERNAKRIFKQVFVYRRMPKEDGVQLTDLEYQTLKLWLSDERLISVVFR